MDQKVLDFLKQNRISVLTTLLSDNTPHSATVHFASSDDASTFVFWTTRKSRKCSHFEEGKMYPASLVVGFDEKEFITFQAEGEVSLVSSEEVDSLYKIYRSKFGGSEKYDGDNEDVLLRFTPKWWRYTEFKPQKFVLNS